MRLVEMSCRFSVLDITFFYGRTKLGTKSQMNEKRNFVQELRYSRAACPERTCTTTNMHLFLYWIPNNQSSIYVHTTTNREIITVAQLLVRKPVGLKKKFNHGSHSSEFLLLSVYSQLRISMALLEVLVKG